MKESRHVNFGAIQAIFLQLSWSQHKLAHSCQGRGQRSNGAINRNIHLFRSFCRGISNLVTPSLTVAELFQKEGMKCKTYPPSRGYVILIKLFTFKKSIKESGIRCADVGSFSLSAQIIMIEG